jgi:hypothetical protein
MFVPSTSGVLLPWSSSDDDDDDGAGGGGNSGASDDGNAMGVHSNPIIPLQVELSPPLPTACLNTFLSVGTVYIVDRRNCGDAFPSSNTICRDAAGGGSMADSLPVFVVWPFG